MSSFSTRAERRTAALAWIAAQGIEPDSGEVQERFKVSAVTARAFLKAAREGTPVLPRPRAPKPKRLGSEDHLKEEGAARKAAKAEAKALARGEPEEQDDDLPWDEDEGEPTRSAPKGGREERPAKKPKRGRGSEETELVSYYSPKAPQALPPGPVGGADLERARGIVSAAQYERFLAAGIVRLSQIGEMAIGDLENMRHAAFDMAAMSEKGPVWLNAALKAIPDLYKAATGVMAEMKAYGKELRALNKERYEHEGAERFADAVVQAVQEMLPDQAEDFLGRVDELCQQPSENLDG